MATKRILLVDDDPDVHRLLEAALRRPDREIESSYDGLDALKRIEAGPFDLVLTDVSMPGMDGLELLERSVKLRPRMPVVVMTGASTPEALIRAIRDHAFAYFSKPFTLDQVSEMVERALHSTPAADDIQVLNAQPQWLALKLRCKLETADRILQFLRELASEFPKAERDNVAMACREILLNAIEHGGGSDPSKYVHITYVRARGAVLYYVRDPGKGFSFESLAHAAVSNPSDAPFDHAEVREQLGMRPGGFGIFITRQLVDEIIYNQTGNEVLLIKYVKPNSAHPSES